MTVHQSLRYFRHFIVLVLAVAVFFAGCSKKSDGGSDEAVLRLSLPAKISNLDSSNIEDVYGNLVAAQICESLYTYHYLKRPFELIPLLAEDLPKISEDKLIYLIKIKQGVYFQDDQCFPEGKGRELKASDFVFTFKRIANIRYASPNWGAFKDRIVGLNDFRAYTKQFKNELQVDYSKEVEGLKALDDYTLQIKMVKPWPQFVDDLTSVVTAPVAKEAVDYYEKDIVTHPIGTGPFQLNKWQRGVYLEVLRNNNWRGEEYPSKGAEGDREAGLLADAGKPIPFVDRIIWRVIEEEQPAWLLFLRGEFERAGIPKDHFNTAVDMRGKVEKEEMRERGIELLVYDQPSLFWLGFNMRDPVLGKNLPLRKALSFAIDRDQINELMYNSRWRVAHSLVHPDLNSYNPELAEAGYMAYDPEKAKELLKEAETVHGGPIPPVTIGWPGSDPFSRQFAQLIQRQVQKVGITLKIDHMDWPTYVEMMNKGQHQIFASGVRFSTPDSLSVFSMFATKYLAPLGNSFFYSVPEFDKMYDRAEVMFPSPERTELFHKMEKMILADYPAVFTSQRVQYVLQHDWVHNYKPHPFLYNTAKYIRIDTEQQKGYKERLKEIKRSKKKKQ